MIPPMNRQEETQAILDGLRGAMSDVRGALIATTDGLAVARSFAEDTDHQRIAAMAATALGLGKRIAVTLGAGEFTETSVSGSQGNAHMYATGPKGVLCVITQPDANLGLLHIEAREAARRIAEIL